MQGVDEPDDRSGNGGVGGRSAPNGASVGIGAIKSSCSGARASGGGEGCGTGLWPKASEALTIGSSECFAEGAAIDSAFPASALASAMGAAGCEAKGAASAGSGAAKGAAESRAEGAAADVEVGAGASTVVGGLVGSSSGAGPGIGPSGSAEKSLEQCVTKGP